MIGRAEASCACAIMMHVQLWCSAIFAVRNYIRCFHFQTESCRNFDFDIWRQNYISWNRANKLKFMDFFRRQDKQGTGTLTRRDFIDGVLSSSNFDFNVSMSHLKDLNSFYTRAVFLNDLLFENIAAGPYFPTRMNMMVNDMKTKEFKLEDGENQERIVTCTCERW